MRPIHTFKTAEIDRMKTYLIANATGGAPASCIDTMNEALRKLLNNSSIPTGGEVHTTMEALHTAGLATARTDVEFLDAQGRRTTGTVRPEHLSASLKDTALTIAGHEVGWSVFGLSIMDGYHSVLISMDNDLPGAPVFYWSDQWSSRGGWQQFTPGGLDLEVERLTVAWWDDVLAKKNKRFRTRATLWRVLGNGP